MRARHTEGRSWRNDLPCTCLCLAPGRPFWLVASPCFSSRAPPSISRALPLWAPRPFVVAVLSWGHGENPLAKQPTAVDVRRYGRDLQHLLAHERRGEGGGVFAERGEGAAWQLVSADAVRLLNEICFSLSGKKKKKKDMTRAELFTRRRLYPYR